MNELPCMNCKKPVPSDEAKIFAEVFICNTCYEQAVRFWEQTEKELKYLLVMLKESIRVSLIEGRFSLPEVGDLKEVSKRSVLEEILRMNEYREGYSVSTESKSR
jgi:hypothetical protein